MVGDPKRLSDLNRIEADVRIICRKCRFEVDWTVAELSSHLFAIGGSTVWTEITRHLVCRRVGCGHPDLWAVPVPYARRQANLPARRGKLHLEVIEAAMKVLEEATARSPRTDVGTVEVRLALLVLHVYIRDTAAVRLFWERAGDAMRRGDKGLRDPLEMIRHRLVQRGWLGPRSRVERLRTWPNPTPAPAGYLVPEGGERERVDE